MTDNFYGEVLTDHNLHPLHKHDLPTATCCHEGVNSTCGDDIVLNLEIKDGIIVNGSYTGSGCAISQASADIMLELVIGKGLEEARHLNELFNKMIHGEINDDELEELEEAGALQNVSKMPARVKCAMLGWRTMETLLDSEGGAP
ncbi:Fe-S cluster assembly sulfur transfer protein SufU [Ruminococcus sp.]|uniref:Fe-S cluster assembly sulfur transfer protein SufU n=1 Tax=Ruminococcus sp. TaxID=41978 RepID=UPI0025FD9C08|nr:SUF system NifU family Fe-S cluster assembly protein [Ruminococcus sp.]MBQ8967294.1 SUF system NifU family Fe-S cluster assembly protein [Ruminococcus sp.]